MNEVVVKGAALAAWKAEHGGPLADLMEPYDNRPRGSEKNLRRPTSVRCLASVNITECWNKCENLRSARTLHEAQRAAKKLAQSVRHI